MERNEQRRIVEALVLASPEPIAAARLAAVVPGGTASLARELVDELNAEYEASRRGFEIREVGGGYQLRTRVELAEFVQELRPKRTQRLSRAALETLSVIAYKQPITRGEVEHVRGVDVGAVVRSLLERDLVRIAGHREIPGRPMLYATTKRFLQLFGLASLEDLPSLRDLRELAEGGSEDAASGEDTAIEPEDALGLAPEDDASEIGASEGEFEDAASLVAGLELDDEPARTSGAGPSGDEEPPAKPH
ncbi:MAG TPA: SMC-Scp complex subunit ScpB [Myxococcota bacterium]|nr:SMC-Scp complex subunit ScpB [Myxococcota bacterium]